MTGDSPTADISAPRIVTSITVKCNVALAGRSYGHWWVERGEESYGWWPSRGVGFLRAITGVPGVLNGIGVDRLAPTDPAVRCGHAFAATADRARFGFDPPCAGRGRVFVAGLRRRNEREPGHSVPLTGEEDLAAGFAGFEAADEPNGDLARVVRPSFVTEPGGDVQELCEFQVTHGELMR